MKFLLLTAFLAATAAASSLRSEAGLINRNLPVATTTTKAPVTTTKAPVTTTKAPVTTTKAPVTTTKAPVTTTQAPVTTTKAPVTTTKAPVTTTKAPVTTTKAPVTTTKASTTTKAPTTTATTAAATVACGAGHAVSSDFQYCQTGSPPALNGVNANADCDCQCLPGTSQTYSIKCRQVGMYYSSVLPIDYFSTAGSTVRSIDLSLNSLISIAYHDFCAYGYNLATLTTLLLNNNNINSVEAYSFNCLTSLTFLNIHFNTGLTGYSEAAPFSGLPNGGNGVVYLDPQASCGASYTPAYVTAPASPAFGGGASQEYCVTPPGTRL